MSVMDSHVETLDELFKNIEGRRAFVVPVAPARCALHPCAARRLASSRSPQRFTCCVCVRADGKAENVEEDLKEAEELVSAAHAQQQLPSAH